MNKPIDLNFKMLKDLDIKKFKKKIGEEMTDETALIAMHKARFEYTGSTDKMKADSKRWLKANGLKRMNGIPW